MDDELDADVVAEAEAIARAAHEAIASFDLDALRELLDESVVWHATGDDELAGTYRGREAVIDALRRQRERGTIDLVEVATEPEPEVVGFAFGSLGGGSLVVSAQSRSECADGPLQTQSLIVVQQSRIMELGTIGLR
jgi:hypothetical protein